MTCPHSSRYSLVPDSDRKRVEYQRNFLINPLPPGDGICAVCRGPAGRGYELCYQCSEHRTAAEGMLADVVAPIAYAVDPTKAIKDHQHVGTLSHKSHKGRQHAHNLYNYKSRVITESTIRARVNLSSLVAVYLARHWDCFVKVTGGEFSHIVTVPSTKNRPGIHPLEQIVTNRIRLSVIRPAVNPDCTADPREFSRDRFRLPEGSVDGARILLIEDAWVSGSRAQSLAFTLKAAGAACRGDTSTGDNSRGVSREGKI